jgi:hypothetical protein
MGEAVVAHTEGGLMPKGGKRVGRSTPPKSLAQESKDNQLWWWIGGAAALLLIGAVVIWLVARPGQAASPTPTPPPTEPAETATPTEEPAIEEATEEETSSMPENPADRNGMYS